MYSLSINANSNFSFVYHSYSYVGEEEGPSSVTCVCGSMLDYALRKKVGAWHKKTYINGLKIRNWNRKEMVRLVNYLLFASQAKWYYIC